MIPAMSDTHARTTGERILREPRFRPVLIRDMPDEQRPRERLRDAGPTALSDAELLAILLRTGTRAESAIALANRLLSEAGGLERLARVSHGELCEFHGFGEAKAAHLLAALELGRRIAALNDDDGPPVLHTSVDVARMMKPLMEFLPQEQLRVLCLNSRNQVMTMSTVFVGTVNGVNVRAVEVFRQAVQVNAPSVVMVHNHPSGDPTPSAADIALTREIAAVGKTLDIHLADHVVVGKKGYVSMLDRQVIKPTRTDEQPTPYEERTELTYPRA